MNTHTNTTTITFSDVFWKFVSLWKLALALAVIGFIIASIYVSRSYAQKEAEYLPKKAEYDRVITEYEEKRDFIYKFNTASPEEKKSMACEVKVSWEEQLPSDQLLQVENALSLKRLIEENGAYQKNSILMNLNPYNVKTLNLIFEVSSETVQLNNILTAYNNYINSDEFINEIATKQGWDTAGKGNLIFSELFTVTVQNGNQFLVTVQSLETEDMESLAENISLVLREKSLDIENSIGAHALQEIGKNIVFKVNNSLATAKNNIQNQQVGYSNQLNNLKNTMKNVPEQFNLYVLKSGTEEDKEAYIELLLPKEPEIQEPAKLRKKNTYRLIGIAIGIVVALMIAYAKMLFSGKIEKTEELTTLYGMNPVGYIYGKRLIPIDNFIVKMKKGRNRPDNNKTAIKLMVDGLTAMCKKSDLRKLSLVSSSLRKADRQTISELTDVLKENGLELISVGNILTDEDVKEKLVKSDAVIIAETIGIAKNRYINEEQQLIDGMGIKLLCAFGIE